MKSIQIRSFFWFMFPCIRTVKENTDQKKFRIGHFLRIVLDLGINIEGAVFKHIKRLITDIDFPSSLLHLSSSISGSTFYDSVFSKLTLFRTLVLFCI